MLLPPELQPVDANKRSSAKEKLISLSLEMESNLNSPSPLLMAEYSRKTEICRLKEKSVQKRGVLVRRRGKCGQQKRHGSLQLLLLPLRPVGASR